MDDYDDYGDSDNFSPVPVVVSTQIDASTCSWSGAKLVCDELIETVETQTEAKGCCSQESACSQKRRQTKGCPQKTVPNHTEDQVCAEQTPKARQR